MPSSWLPAALQAQAIAARSYALASKQAGAPFDVYADGRSQAYLGVSAETPAGRQAVDATAGEVLLYNGAVADPLLLEHRRPDAVGVRRVRASGPALSRLRAGSLRHHLPVPRLGAGAGDRDDARERGGSGGPRRRRDRQAQRVAPREDAEGHLALARPAAHGHASAARLPRRRSGFARRGSASASSRCSRRPRIPRSLRGRGSR